MENLYINDYILGIGCGQEKSATRSKLRYISDMIEKA